MFMETFPFMTAEDLPYAVPMTASVMAGEEVWSLKLPEDMFIETFPSIAPLEPIVER